VVMQIGNVFLCRHPLRSTLDRKSGGNRLLRLGIASELALIAFILYTPAGNWLFGSAPISGTTWLLAIGCALLMWSLEELRKAILRRAGKD